MVHDTQSAQQAQIYQRNAYIVMSWRQSNVLIFITTIVLWMLLHQSESLLSRKVDLMFSETLDENPYFTNRRYYVSLRDIDLKKTKTKPKFWLSRWIFSANFIRWAQVCQELAYFVLIFSIFDILKKCVPFNSFFDYC